MALNLHATVRGAINSVNPDIAGSYLASTGFTRDAASKRTPTYAAGVAVMLQVQPPSSSDLKKINLMNLAGVLRTVFMFGTPQSVVRLNVQGGDLLKFPQIPGGPVCTWLIAKVDEGWQWVGNSGWSKLFAVLQTDAATDSVRKAKQ